MSGTMTGPGKFAHITIICFGGTPRPARTKTSLCFTGTGWRLRPSSQDLHPTVITKVKLPRRLPCTPISPITWNPTGVLSRSFALKDAGARKPPSRSWVAANCLRIPPRFSSTPRPRPVRRSPAALPAAFLNQGRSLSWSGGTAECGVREPSPDHRRRADPAKGHSNLAERFGGGATISRVEHLPIQKRATWRLGTCRLRFRIVRPSEPSSGPRRGWEWGSASFCSAAIWSSTS